MKIQHEIQNLEAICENCRKFVKTTAVRRTVPFSDNSGEVKDILVDVCSECNEMVAIPPESFDAISKEYQRIKKVQEKFKNQDKENIVVFENQTASKSNQFKGSGKFIKNYGIKDRLKFG